VNWHLGRLKVAGKWMTISAAEEHATNDPQLAEYRKLREKASDNGKLLRNLARWCLKVGWDDAARLHYAQLLCRSDADAEMHTEAIKRLELQNIGGAWTTRQEREEQQRKAKATDEAVVKWRPVLERLGAAINGG